VKSKQPIALPSSELEICNRLRVLLEREHWPQRLLGESIGQTRDHIANQAYGRVRVRFTTALRVCAFLNRSLRWLATGKKPYRLHTTIAPSLLAKIKPNEYLSTAYSEVLGRLYEERINELAKDCRVTVEELDEFPDLKDFRPLGMTEADKIWETSKLTIDSLVSQMPDDAKRAVADDFVHRALFILAQSQGVKNLSLKNGLLSITESRNSSAVKSEVQKLMRRVATATESFGKKAELARHLDVAPARINEWLRGENEPGGDYTLRLLHWVQQQEQK
jgi:transcriptional regulator with XRE-family HTH domain